MRRIALPLIVAVFALVSASCATSTTSASVSPATPTPTAATPPLTPDAATQLLVNADVFEGEAVGIDGHVSDGVAAFRVIFASDDAVDRFVRVARHGKTAGRLYAAIGLRALDATAYQEAIAALRAQQDSRIKTRAGCFLDDASVESIVEDTGGHAIRLAEGERLDDWMRTHKTGAVDIVGGALTELFRPSRP